MSENLNIGELQDTKKQIGKSCENLSYRKKKGSIWFGLIWVVIRYSDGLLFKEMK
jgi:hypothetical protein